MYVPADYVIYKINMALKKRCPACNIKLTVIQLTCRMCCEKFCVGCQIPEAHHCVKLMIKEPMVLPSAIIPSKIEKV